MKEIRLLRADEIEVRVQAVRENGCSLLLYKDARCDMKILDETFGICENKRKATDKQKAEIKSKKDEIIKALLECKTLEDMLACEVARPYMSAAWKETSEAMIVRKMRNNAIKKHPKDLNAMATQSLMQMDETYQQTQEEIAENANSEDFVVDAEAKEVESAAVEAEVVESAENDENLPDFMKD